MKKLLFAITAAFLLIITTKLSAQNFSIGPRIGLNFATLTDGNTASDSRTGLVAGITSTYSINEKSGIGVDLLYSSEGSSLGNNIDLSLDYLRLPIMFQYFFGALGEDFRPKIYAGVVPGLLLNAERGNTEVTDNYEDFDLAGTAGLGFHYRLSPKGVWLNADARYLRGFTDIDQGGADTYNQHWQLSLGVSFGVN